VRALVDRLREVSPNRIFLAVDGPRADRATDATLVERTRRCTELIDWPCEVQTLFQEKNLGCGRGVSTAITWFFDQVTEGIVLEDDVLPRVEFFAYCAELLDRYRDDSRVFAISGSNFVPTEEISTDGSYRFTHITHVWGWATWRRSWNQYHFDIRDWRRRLPTRQRWQATGGNIRDFIYWSAVLEWVSRGHIDTWDYQLNLAQMSAGAMCATSNVNLVDNLGFADDATHTERPSGTVRPSAKLTFPLRHPAVAHDWAADHWYSRQVFWESVRGGLRRLLGR
jgi:hypothetical protein